MDDSEGSINCRIRGRTTTIKTSIKSTECLFDLKSWLSRLQQSTEFSRLQVLWSMWELIVLIVHSILFLPLNVEIIGFSWSLFKYLLRYLNFHKCE